MARLYRPSIPVEVKCRVALRQTGELWPDEVIRVYRGRHGFLLRSLLTNLAQMLRVEASDLRLDHDPALVNRIMHTGKAGIWYEPAANDPEHLIYRTKAAHDIKTRVRGDGAQLSDLAIVRKRKRKAKKTEKRKWWSAVHGKYLPGSRPKHKWATGRKIQNRGFR